MRKATDFLTMSFDTVTIRVDSPAVDITVYKDVICAAAPYFRRAFDGHFKEADEGMVRLPDVPEKTFRIFLQWAHSQDQPGLGGVVGFAPDDLPKEHGERSDGSSTIDETKISNKSCCEQPPIVDETAAECQPAFDEIKMTKLYWENE